MTRKKKGPRAPHPKKQGVVRIERRKPYPRSLFFVFSEDVIESLVQMYDLDWGMFSALRGEMRYRTLRLEFARLGDLGQPLVFVRIEPPTYDPHGSRIRRIRHSHQYTAQVLASKVRVRDNLPSQALNYFWGDRPGHALLQPHGLFIQFNDEDMILAGPGDVVDTRNLAVESSRL